MSAGLLREAAALMRERAEAATTGAWWQSGAWFDHDGTPMPMVGYGSAGADWIARTRDQSRGDARHIASWHPAVALAVAMLLDNEANALDAGHAPENFARTALLEDVARAYLGRDA